MLANIDNDINKNVTNNIDKNITSKVIYSDSFDPWFNLSLEEYLLENLKENEIILYLWQNANTVVIGNNQNPWKECNIEDLSSDVGKLARRLSGGGAVYHDMGNVNFTFIASKDNFNIEKQLSVIIDAVRKFNIKASFSGRNDIEAYGKKFSGNAFYYGDKSSYHHGTVLLNVDKSKLPKYLQVSKEKIKSKGIDSVKSRVINLKELNNNINVESLNKALVESFKKIYKLNNIEESVMKKEDFENISCSKERDIKTIKPLEKQNLNKIKHQGEENIHKMKKLYEKYSSWQWLYGETPLFDIRYEKRFIFGDIDINLNVSKGVINDTKVYSDSLNTKLPIIIEEALKGITFEKYSVMKALKNITNQYVKSEVNGIEDIILWLQKDF